jgi:5-methylcytosine-specific restriction endonuclease McrA
VASHIEGTVLVTKRLTKSTFRREIIDAWNGACAYCGCQPEKVTLDHVIPKAKGGTTHRANLVPACAGCNVAKNHCDVWAWYHDQPFFCADRSARIRQWHAPG